MIWKTTICAVILGSALTTTPGLQASESATLKVDVEVALSSLIALGDGHLEKMAASLAVLATSSETRSTEWSNIKAPLADLAALNVPALLWFALPDGSYWDLEEGKAEGNLSERAYFPKVLAGEVVIGDLVVSKATGKNVAIVAVPVQVDGKVVAVLGSSIYLDRLSALLQSQMSLDENTIFYAFDAQPLLAVVWDEGLIFQDPTALSPAVRRAFQKMMRDSDGTVTYPFRGQERTVRYQKSEVTDWWYAFGKVKAETPSGK